MDNNNDEWGTHLSAFKEGFLKAVNDHFKNWSAQDVRENSWCNICKNRKSDF